MGNFTIILSIRVPTGLIAAKVPPIELELPGPVAKQVTPAFAAIFGCGHQCHLTDMAGTLVGIQQPAQQVSALLGSMLNDLAILEGNMESLDELAIEHIGLGAVDDAVHLILVGSSEHFLGGDVGQEEHVLLVLAAGALPAGLLGQAHGQVSAVGALKVDALQIKGIHLLAQTGQTVQMCLPLVDGVTAGHAADIKDELPQLLDGGIRFQLGEHLLCPGGAGHGGNGPLHPVVHGVLPPGSHKFPVGGVHTADLGSFTTAFFLCRRPAETLLFVLSLENQPYF